MEEYELEEWWDVIGFEGYQVSDLGNVRSLDRYIQVERNGKRHQRNLRGRVLRPGRMPSGHVLVALGAKANSKKVHALVLLAFVGPRPAGLEVRHLNGKPDDNRLENLEYATRTRNSQDKKWHAGQKGYRLSVENVRDIKRRLAARDASALAREYGVAATTISAIRRNLCHRDIMP